MYIVWSTCLLQPKGNWEHAWLHRRSDKPAIYVMFTPEEGTKQPPLREVANRKYNINRNAETTLAIAKKLVFPFCLYEVCRTGKMQARTLLSQKKLHYNALLQREMNWWAQKYILKVKGQETNIN
jgi:hypothetical protein